MKIFVDGSKRAAVSRMFPVWEKMGHKIVNNLKDADVQLSIIRVNVRGNAPIVLRLDGIYYDKAENYNKRNNDINKAYLMADAVVYQSNLSKIMCEKYLDNKKTKIYDIIYNGIDPVGWNNFKNHDGINVVACAKWRRWKRLPETIEVFIEFLKYYSEAKLHIIGPMKRGSKVIKHTNIIYHNPNKKIDFEKMKKIYCIMDMYLHLSKKDWCPSSVVEAIAAGIPIITTNACGGATEMCLLTKGSLIVPGEPESLESDYIYRNEYNKLPKEVIKNIVKAMIEIVKDRRRIVLPKELTIETSAKKYIKIMEKVL